MIHVSEWLEQVREKAALAFPGRRQSELLCAGGWSTALQSSDPIAALGRLASRKGPGWRQGKDCGSSWTQLSRGTAPLWGPVPN